MIEWNSATGEGIPILHFDQLNIIAQHIHAIKTGTMEWNDPLVWPDPLIDMRGPPLDPAGAGHFLSN